MLSEKLYQCRIHKKMSLDTLADKLGVSRQAVQKWESGVTKPTIENLLALSEIFNVSLDYLCGNYRLMHEEGFRMGYEITPSFEKQPTWECYSKELEVEYRQSVEEGKDIEAFKELFSEVSSLPDGKYKDKIADVLFEIVTQAPQRADYKYTEPSDLGRIRQFTKPYDLPMPLPDDDILLDKILGGWLGRVCGCFLGKPVEGIMEPELRKILKRTGNYPMHRYIDKEECTEEVMDGLNWNIAACAYPRDYGKMPCDDDTNYTIMGYKIIERYGKDFTAENVASMWLATQVKNAYCTAERVAYRNFVNGYLPPESAEYKNPYREWIGAQIRGDFFGYFNPCNPRMAAEMAHRDASISHIKNGIYGEMFVSAMIAAAFSTKNPEEVIRCGMAEIPSTSRLYEAIEKVLEGYNNGTSEKDFFVDLHKRWNEQSSHDWCHTISNAEIVAACLLYGKKDYARSVGMAVEQGFDTDCNGATVGSILGVMLGGEALPEEFTGRVCDTLCSNISGYSCVSITDMAKKTLALMKKTT